METVWGVKWPVPTTLEIALLTVFFLILIFVALLLYYRLIIQNRKSHEFRMILCRNS